MGMDLRLGLALGSSKRRGIPGDPIVYWKLPLLQDTIGEYIIDSTPGVGTHQAVPRISTKFDGVLYGKMVDDAGVDTSITLVGDFIIKWSGETIGNDNAIVGAIDADSYLRVSGTNAIIKINNITSAAFVLDMTKGGTVARVGSLVTMDNGTVTVSLNVTSNDFTFGYVGRYTFTFQCVGNLYDIHMEDSTGVVFSNYLAQYNPASNIMESEVGPKVLVVGNTGDWTEESLAFGHDWNLSGYSDVENLLSLSSKTPINKTTVKSRSFITETFTALPNTTYTFSLKVNVLSNLNASYIQILFFLTIPSGATTTSIFKNGVEINAGDIAPLGEYTLEISCIVGATGGTTIIRYGLGTTASVTASADFSIVWLISSEDANYVQTVGHAIQGRIPEDPSNLGYDVTGGALTNPGKARNDFAITGYGPNFDGVAYVDTGYVPNAGFESGSLECDWTVGSVIGYSLSGIYGTSTNLFVGNRDGAFVAGFGALSFNEIKETVGTATIGKKVLLRLQWDATRVQLLVDGEIVSDRVRSGGIATNTYPFAIGARATSPTGLTPSNMVTGSITNVKLSDSTGLVKEWLLEGDPADTTVTTVYDRVGGSHGTWVGATQPIYSVPKDGSLLLAGGYSEGLTDGVELVVNGGFDTDTGWSKDAGWTINNGKANCNSVVAANIYKVGVFTLGKKYTFTVTLSGYSAGSGLRVYCGLGDSFELPTVDGTYSFTLTCTTNTTSYIGATTGGYTGSVDSISAQEITTGLVPASLTTPTQDVFGNALTHLPGRIYPDTPVLLTAPDSGVMFDADTIGQVDPNTLLTNDPINFLYEPDEDKIPFTPAEMFPQSGGGLSYSLNDQYWFGQKGIAFYPAPLETKDATKMITYIKPYEA